MGRLSLIAAQESSRAPQAHIETGHLEYGADLHNIADSELIGLSVPALRDDFFRRLQQRQLLQYGMRREPVGRRGGIIVALDDSASMGQMSNLAMAAQLVLLGICHQQNRPFTSIHFGGPGHYKIFRFRTADGLYDCETEYGGVVGHHRGLDGMIELASTHFRAGGTCFQTPLGVAVEELDREFELTGACGADVVMMTDGWAGISEDWYSWFMDNQDRLGFKMFGLRMGSYNARQPLDRLCDGRSIDLHEVMAAPDQLRSLLKEVQRR
jgi:uncharacterized protein with von Willebrand factor type A (vWA) domain